MLVVFGLNGGGVNLQFFFLLLLFFFFLIFFIDNCIYRSNFYSVSVTPWKLNTRRNQCWQSKHLNCNAWERDFAIILFSALLLYVYFLFDCFFQVSSSCVHSLTYVCVGCSFPHGKLKALQVPKLELEENYCLGFFPT